MATKLVQLSFYIFLITLAFPLPSHARPSKRKAENPSFDFINQLEGCKKGQTVKGVQQLRTYLEAFGYLNYSPYQTHANNNFDDALEAAIKMYQVNFHLNTTGTLDAQTVSKMTAPRCGVPDIVNGTNCMQLGKNKANHTHSTLHTVSHYSFFPRNLKWPSTKYELTYGFPPGTNSDAMSAVARAFSTWASQTHFTFLESPNFESADLKIGFYRGDHGDGAPFYGANGAIAHSFAPTDGRFHYNKDHSFSVNPVAGSFHLESVALHEIGHLLGLGHTNVQEAIMFPTIAAATTKGLNVDDIQGIKTLYNLEE